MDQTPGGADAARVVTVPNPKGMHARPASKLAKLTQTFDAAVAVEHNGEMAEADSIMDLLMLGAGPGAALRVTASGPDAAAAVAAVAGLVERGFDEM